MLVRACMCLNASKFDLINVYGVKRLGGWRGKTTSVDETTGGGG